MSYALKYMFQVFKRNVRLKLEVSRQEQYDNLRLTLVSGQYCSLQRSLLWSSYTGPSTSPPLLIAFLELLFCDAVHHHLAFNLNLHSILKSLSHIWIFIYGSRKTLEGNCCHFYLILHTKNQFCFWSFNRWGTNVAAVCVVFKP